MVAMKPNCNSWDNHKLLIRFDMHLLFRLRIVAISSVQLHELGREAVDDWLRMTLGESHYLCIV